MDEEVVYFELNDWFAGEDYPCAEPFLTWCGNDRNLYFCNENFVKENKLCVVQQVIDMSINWCITAPKSFVLKYCPKLLSDETTSTKFVRTCNGVSTEYEKTFPYSHYLRFPDEDADADECGIVYGRFGTKFLEYKPENIGIKYEDD